MIEIKYTKVHKQGINIQDGMSVRISKKNKKNKENSSGKYLIKLSTINAIENSLKYNHSNLSNYKSLNKRYNEALSDQK